MPTHIRADHGPAFTDRVAPTWLTRAGSRLIFIDTGSLWEKGYIESFRGKLRDELLARAI